MLQWILEEAIPRRYPDAKIIERVLVVNFAAIHTSSVVRKVSIECTEGACSFSVTFCLQSITHALLDLAAHPQYIQPLRDEVEAIVSAEGWTKAGMGKMWKIDSFLKESQRVNGIALSTSSVHVVSSSDLC